MPSTTPGEAAEIAMLMDALPGAIPEASLESSLDLLPADTPEESQLDFSDHYSVEELRGFMDSLNSRNAHVKQGTAFSDLRSRSWESAHIGHIETLSSAVAFYLSAMGIAGRLVEIPFSERRNHLWADSWNRMVRGELSTSSYDVGTNMWMNLSIVGKPIREQILLKLTFLRNHPVEEVFQGLVEFMNDGGEIEGWQMGVHSRSECDVTGTELGVVVGKGWQPRLAAYKPSSGSGGSRHGTYSLLTQEAPEPGVMTLEIPAPTGEMLVTDWFRCSRGGHRNENVFTSIVDLNKPIETIETGFHRASMSQHYARNHGFMSIFVGESRPSIVVRPDHLMIAEVSENQFDDEGELNLEGIIAGRVEPDHWWVTMIDRKVLVDMLATHMDLRAAEADVTDMVRKGKVAGTLTVLQVPPGVVYAHFTPHTQDLDKFRCIEKDIGFSRVKNACVVVSATPVNWVALCSEQDLQAIFDAPLPSPSLPRAGTPQREVQQNVQGQSFRADPAQCQKTSTEPSDRDGEGAEGDTSSADVEDLEVQPRTRHLVQR